MRRTLWPARVDLADANAFVALHHRHHKPVHRVRFNVGAQDKDGKLRAVAMAGRPVARACDHRTTLEVVRSCSDGFPNACSFVLGQVVRIAREMAFHKVQSYILDVETGVSLKAAGWRMVASVDGRPWFHTDGKPRRQDQPTCDKQRWEIDLRPGKGAKEVPDG